MITTEEIEKRVQTVIQDQFGKKVEPKDVNSVQFVKLIVRIEDEFDVNFDFDDMNVDLIGEKEKLIQYLYKKLNEK